MADIATLALAIDSRPVADASKELDRITAAARKAEDAATGFGKRTEDAGRRAAAANDNVARSANKVTAAYDKWHTAARRVAAAVGAIAGALAVRSLTSYADAWSDMQSRVGAAVRDMEAAPELMNRIVDIANASYSPLDQTVEIFSRNVLVLRDLGKSATEAADFTEALNHALVLTATRGERAASVQNALSKAMAIGKMQAQELETILAHGGEVAQALADELGTNVNGLRAMASAGKITGDVIANALIKRLDDLRDRAGEMPATIEDAFVRIRTNLTAFVGTLDKASGVSEMLAGALISVADGIDWLRGAFVTLMSNLDQVAEAAATAGVALAIAFGPAIIASVQALVVAIGTGMVTAFHTLTAAMAANPLGAFAVAVVAAVSAAYYFRDTIKEVLGIDVVQLAKDAANYVIGSFVAAYEDIKFVWNNFGDIMGAAVIGGVNIAIDAINGLVQKAAEGLDWLIGKINKIPGVNISEIGTVNPIGTIDNPYAKRLGAAVEQRNAAVEAAMARDYIGELGAAFKTSEQAAADFGSAVATANQNLENTGGGGGAADKAAKAIKGVKDEADKAAESARKFGADLVKGFVSDLRSGLEQGKGFWESFANAATRALDRIVDKLLNDVIDAIFQVNSVGGGGGLLGMLGGMFGMQMFPGGMGFATPGYTPWAKGGAFYHGNVIPFAKGGIVHGPTVFPFAKGIGLMGEAGPEAIMPLHRGPDGSLGVKAANQNHANQNIRVEVEVFVNDDGTLGAIARQAGGEAAQVTVKQGLAAYDKSRQKRYQAGGQFG